MSDVSSNNKRIAKNTLLLYIRTMFVMVVSLYTSRVILDVLGVDDYGIYSIVGGVVAMFTLLSGSLSAAISRFITFELGKGDYDKLKLIFSTSVNIQIGISLIVLVLGGVVGGWFLNVKMNIPPERMVAANWVLFCSLVMFCINLISVPYNSLIIAHERMSAFAYISIIEVILKLLVCYLILVSPFDKLISYAILLVIVSLIIRITYGIYCNKHFPESRYSFAHDKSLLKRMGGFAGWSFLTNACYMFNTQGVNILINIFFGVALNAARGIAVHVDGVIMQFVNNFTVAISPQITKNYAAGKKQEMFTLVCRGAKFSYFLIFLIGLPVILEANYVMSLWLVEVPEHAVVFLQLSIIGLMVNLLGGTGYTACQATGNLKRYVIWLSTVGCFVFPLTWIAFELGAPVESTYVIYILVYALVNVVRLYIMRGLLDFPIMMFIKDVVFKISTVTLVAIIAPIVIDYLMEESFLKLVVIVLISLISSSLCIYAIGLTKGERVTVSAQIKKITNKIFTNNKLNT